MKKQLIVFFVVLVALVILAQVLLVYDKLSWQILMQSILAGVLSTFVFWAIIKNKKTK